MFSNLGAADPGGSQKRKDAMGGKGAGERGGNGLFFETGTGGMKRRKSHLGGKGRKVGGKGGGRERFSQMVERGSFKVFGRGKGILLLEASG